MVLIYFKQNFSSFSQTHSKIRQPSRSSLVLHGVLLWAFLT